MNKSKSFLGYNRALITPILSSNTEVELINEIQECLEEGAEAFTLLIERLPLELRREEKLKKFFTAMQDKPIYVACYENGDVVRETDVERAFHGFVQAHVDEHQGAEPDECYPCHDGLRGEGECHDIGCRDAACHVVAVHVGCLHESCILRHGDGATARRSGKGGGEVLGEDLALGAAGVAVLRHVEHGALCLYGDVELGANEVGVVDGVGHVHGGLDAGEYTEWATNLGCNLRCQDLRGR